MEYKVGEKVICIDDSTGESSGIKSLILNKIYTIKEIRTETGALSFDEVTAPKNSSGYYRATRFKKYIENNFKKGDKIRILRKPKVWASTCNDNYPLQEDIKYPFECTIDKIKGFGQAGGLGMSAGDYGWDLTNLIENNLIELVEPKLPESWYIAVKNQQEFDTWIKWLSETESKQRVPELTHLKTKIDEFPYYVRYSEDDWGYNGSKTNNYKNEITFEQFEKYILKAQVMKEIEAELTFPREMMVWDNNEEYAQKKMVLGIFEGLYISKSLTGVTYSCWLNAKEIPIETVEITMEELTEMVSDIKGKKVNVKII